MRPSFIQGAELYLSGRFVASELTANHKVLSELSVKVEEEGKLKR
jgi:hypothetical protein